MTDFESTVMAVGLYWLIFGGIWCHFARNAVGISQHIGGFGGQNHAGWCGGEAFWGWGWLRGREGKVKVRGEALDL